MSTMLQERIDLTQLQEASDATNALPQVREHTTQQLSQENPMPIYPVEGENQGSPNEMELVSEQPEPVKAVAEEKEATVPDVQVREIQDKHGNTRYMKQGVNPKTRSKYTSFITKEEAEVLQMTAASRENQPVFDVSHAPDFVKRAFEKVDAEDVEDIRDSRSTYETIDAITGKANEDALLEKLPDFVKETVVKSDEKTPLTDDDEEISGEHLALTPEQEAVLTPNHKDLEIFHAKTDYAGKHFVKNKDKYQPKHMKEKQTLRSRARAFLGKAISKTNVQLGLTTDPEQTFSKLPPKYHEKNMRRLQEEAKAKPAPWMPPVHPDDLVSKPVSGEVKIAAERASEDHDQAA